MAEKTVERTVKIKAHSYRAYVPNPRDPDSNILVRRVAKRGETIELSEDEAARGDALDAFGTGKETEESAAIEVAGMDDEELVTWIEENDPTVQDVVDASAGNGALAQRLLDAETSATGGDPRKGVVKGLAAVIDRDNE